MSQAELPHRLDMARAAVGELILRIERSGFIQRQLDPRDHRTKRMVIAAHGREILELMPQPARHNHSAIMAGISEEEEALLDDVLARMKRNLLGLLRSRAGTNGAR